MPCNCYDENERIHICARCEKQDTVALTQAFSKHFKVDLEYCIPHEYCKKCFHSDRLMKIGYCDCGICWDLQKVNFSRDRFGRNGYDKRFL